MRWQTQASRKQGQILKKKTLKAHRRLHLLFKDRIAFLDRIIITWQPQHPTHRLPEAGAPSRHLIFLHSKMQNSRKSLTSSFPQVHSFQVLITQSSINLKELVQLPFREQDQLRFQDKASAKRKCKTTKLCSSTRVRRQMR